jgi:molecular chaperone DnaK (HSP70)
VEIELERQKENEARRLRECEEQRIRRIAEIEERRVAAEQAAAADKARQEAAAKAKADEIEARLEAARKARELELEAARVVAIKAAEERERLALVEAQRAEAFRLALIAARQAEANARRRAEEECEERRLADQRALREQGRSRRRCSQQLAVIGEKEFKGAESLERLVCEKAKPLGRFSLGVDLGATEARCSIFDGEDKVANRTFVIPGVVVVQRGKVIVAPAELNEDCVQLPPLKRFLGLQFSDPAVQKALPGLPETMAKIEDPVTGELRLRFVDNDGRTVTVTPAEVATAQFREIALRAATEVGEKVENAAISVPFGYSSDQRKALRCAAKEGGLTITRLVTDPLAAAVALREEAEPGKCVIIVDVGQCQTSVSAVEYRAREVSEVRTCGMLGLGSAGICERLVADVLPEFQEFNRGRLTAALEGRLRGAVNGYVENPEQGAINVECDAVGKFKRVITEAELRGACQPVLDGTAALVGEAQDALGGRPVGSTVFTGNTTRLLASFESEIGRLGKNPEQRNALVVADGARDVGRKEEDVTAIDCELHQVAAHSIGVTVLGVSTDFLINQGAPLPASGTAIYQTVSDDQRQMQFMVTEGEYLSAGDNVKLGTVEVSCPPQKRGEVTAKVHVLLDRDSILHFIASADRREMKFEFRAAEDVKVGSNKGFDWEADRRKARRLMYAAEFANEALRAANAGATREAGQRWYKRLSEGKEATHEELVNWRAAAVAEFGASAPGDWPLDWRVATPPSQVRYRRLLPLPRVVGVANGTAVVRFVIARAFGDIRLKVLNSERDVSSGFASFRAVEFEGDPELEEVFVALAFVRTGAWALQISTVREGKEMLLDEVAFNVTDVRVDDPPDPLRVVPAGRSFLPLLAGDDWSLSPASSVVESPATIVTKASGGAVLTATGATVMQSGGDGVDDGQIVREFSVTRADDPRPEGEPAEVALSVGGAIVARQTLRFDAPAAEEAVEMAVGLEYARAIPDDRTPIEVSGAWAIDVCFAMDATGSMSGPIAAGRESIVETAAQLRAEYPGISFRFACIGYRDPVDSPSDLHAVWQFSEDADGLSSWLGNLQAMGGGDGPEDFVGAVQEIGRLSWRPGANRGVIWIADAPAHGASWGGHCKHQDQDRLLEDPIREFARSSTAMVTLTIGDGARPTFEKMRRIYAETDAAVRFSIAEFSGSASDVSGIADALNSAVGNLVASSLAA